MSRLFSLGAAATTLAVAVLALLADPTPAWADSPFCKATGCPTGTQLCATIAVGIPGAGTVTFYCYQPAPSGGSGKDDLR